MSDQANSNQSENQVLSKATLLERIRHYRAVLDDTIEGLDEQQLNQLGSESWAVKDHLAHLATWELGVAELLKRKPRFAAMGVETAFQQGKSETEINDLIFRQNRDLSAGEALEKFERVHADMMALLDNLNEADLHRPYSDYVPGGDAQRKDPVIFWVIGNTYAHFDEHTAYIRKLLEKE